MRPKQWIAITFTFTLMGGWELGAIASPSADPPAPEVRADGGRAADPGRAIRFNFKGATFEQVIDFFSRAAGLPVIWETEAPSGTLDYLSPDAYDLPEALRVLNIILHSKGVMLRVSEDMLYLQKLSEVQRSNLPTFIGHIPAEVTSEQIVTVVRPLRIALAKPLAERLAEMVAAYGAVAALEQQNAIVITETAAQVRRLLTIVEEIDRADPEGEVELFRIKHAKAADLVPSIKAIMSEKVEVFVVNPQGQQVKRTEDHMPGVSITADDRTNAIIAKGAANRIETVRQAIALLDVPAASAGAGRAIRTITLGLLSPADAARRLNDIYVKLPEPERPAVLPLNEFSQVTIVGSDTAIAEGVALLADIDGPGSDGDGRAEAQRTIAVTVLEHADAAGIIRALQSLLSPRQIATTKVVAGPDGRSVIVSGANADVAAVQAVIPTLDRPTRIDRQLRLLRVPVGEDASATLARCVELYQLQIDGDDPQDSVNASLDVETGTITVIGSAAALDRFAAVLRSIESTIVQRETRQVRCQHARPSELAETLRDLSARMQTTGRPTEPPRVDPFDELDLLLITATNEQHQALAPLVQSLDVPKDRSVPPLRILQLRIADANNLASTLNRQYQQRPVEERNAKPVTISADGQTNALIVAAHPDVLPEIQAIVDELNEPELRGREYDGREIRIFPLKVARAEELARTIDEMFPQPPPPVDARGRPLPHLQQPREVVVRADRQTNSLIVDAPLQRMSGFDQLVEQLDRQQFLEETEVRTYRVAHADLNSIANTLRQLASGGTLSPAGHDRRVGITIAAEPMSRALIVSGPADIFDRVERVLGELDVRQNGPETTLRFFKLTNARAENIAEMLRQVLLTRIAEEFPEAGSRALLNVSADRKTNTLILSAPSELMPIAEELIRQLDDTTASLGDPVVRIKPLTFADAREVSQALAQAMAGLISTVTGDPISVRLTAAPGSNALILVGLEGDLVEVEKLIEPLDARPAMDAIDARTFPLEFADAAAVAPIVQRLLADQQETDPRIMLERIRQTRGQLALTPRIRVEADTRTNSLIVSGPQQTVALASSLIDKLDVAGVDELADRTLRTFTPANANPQTLAQSVQRMILATRPRNARQTETIELFAEAQSGAVVVIGPADEVEYAVELLAQRDRETLTPPQLDLKIVNLENSDANVMAQALSGLLRDQSRWPEKLRAAGRTGITVAQPAVIADAPNNRVLISAPQELMAMAQQLVAELDQPREVGGPGAMDVRIFQLAQAQAGNVANAVRVAMDAKAAPGRARPSITAEPSSNSVIVTAVPEQMGEIEALIAPLDKGVQIDQAQVRTVFLRHARAETIAPTVRQLLAGEELPAWIRYDAISRNRQLPETGPDVRVAADQRLNAVVISAPPQVLNIAEELVAQLDVDPVGMPGSGRSVRVLAVRNADASELAANLQSLFSEDDQPDAPPTIRVDQSSNTLLVRATGEQFGVIEEVVSRIDRATIATSRQMQLIQIDPSRASAAEVALTLQRLLDRPGAPGSGNGSGSVQVITLEELLRQREEPKEPVAPSIPASGTSSLDEIDAPRRATESHGEGSERARWHGHSARANSGESCGQNARTAFQFEPHGISHSPLRGSPWPSVVNLLAMSAIGATPFDDLADDEDHSPDITIAVDEATNSLIVIGAPRMVDRLTQLAQQVQAQFPAAPGRVRYVSLPEQMDAGALSRLLTQTLAQMSPAGGRRGEYSTRVGVIVDPAANALILTCNDADFAVVGDLLAALAPLDVQGAAAMPLRVIELRSAQPTRAAEILRQVVLSEAPRTGRRPEPSTRGTRTMIVPDDNSGILLVRASEEINAEIDRVIREIDRDAAQEFEIRTIVLERANAASVATAIQRFYDDRARIASVARGRRDQARRISIVGDPASRTLLVAASDTDFAQIQEIVAQFDSPQATSALTFRVFELRHARATEIHETVQQLINDLMWNQEPFFFWPPRPSQQRDRGTLAVRADARLNALIVTGEGDRFEMAEQLIELLDAPAAGHAQRQVKLYRINAAQTRTVADVVTEIFGDGGRSQARWWMPPDPSVVNVRVDEASKTLIISASAREHEEIALLIAGIDEQVASPDQETKVLAVEFAQANEIAQTLRQFLIDRARAVNAPAPRATIIASPSANSLIVSAGEDELLTIRDLLARLDQPDVSGDRVIEIIALQDAQAVEIARIVREQFARRGGAGGQGVTITPDARTNSLIVNAPQQQFAQARALIDRLDTPAAADETIIRTYSLEGARADEAQRLLAQTLQLDERGRTPGRGITIRLEDDEDDIHVAVEVKAKIVADRRSNTLIVTATAESFPVIESLIRKIDAVPAVNPVEYRIIKLEHALADDVAFTLRQVSNALPAGEPRPRIDYNRFENQLIIGAAADQFEQINTIIAQIDQPSQRQRITDFVPLQFAEAQKIQEALSVFYGPMALEADTPGKRNVRIVADPATNSLVISADANEWEGIRGLLSELDSEEYDSSLQLRVIPLVYADSRSVARAINEAFQGTIERGRAARAAEQRRPTTQGRDDDRRDMMAPAVLVESDEWVRAAAEPLTNSVIISASRQNVRKIEQIIEQLDVADYAKLPPPQLIPVTTGDPARLADSLNRLYEQGASGGERARGGKGLVIVGDAVSNTIIVRAEDVEFRQIKALAEALQQQAGEQGMSVQVLRLTAAPAARVRSAILDAFTAKARQTNQPLSIQVDAQGNSLIIASTGGLFREIEETVRQLDALSPGAGQSIFIIELENISPEAAKSVIESIGLHQRQPDDSVSRLVSEPIKVSVLQGRNALIVVANPADRDTIVGFLKAVDAEPQLAEAQMRIVRLKNADAASIARILGEVLAPANQQVQTPLARAIQEQVRRLSVRGNGLNELDPRNDLYLDLTKPIRVIPDAKLNAVVIASTAENVRAIEQVVAMFDQLPITDAVTVQIFPLQNIAAEQFSRIVRDLFSQGRQLGTMPLTNIPALPGGMVGKALIDQIAITTDERTNTVIVAGKEDSVALVEVLSKRLDSDIAAGWVEPRIIQLRFADAGDLAQTLQAVLVDGISNLPQATPIQRQIGRLRMARLEQDGGRVLESDVFQPMTRLVIRPEPQMNALVLVGTPVNLEIVGELVKMLDVEAASPSAAVRIYPIEHASAARLATTITRLFDQQVQSKAIRPEDRVIVQAEERTNTLIVTTSPRSFAVLESLLKTLDAEIAPDLREIRRIELRNASATRLASLVQQLMDARLERMRRVQPETADLERATIVADARTNSLIVAAGNESFEVIRRLASDLDTSTLTDVSLVNVLPAPGSGNVDRLASAINRIMERRYADQPAEIRNSQRPLVLTDPRSNSLLVAANPEDLAAIIDLVTKLGETPLNPAIGLHVVSAPPNMRAEQLGPRVQRLMQERQQSLGDARTPSDRVSIEPDMASNSLIIAATEENLEVIRGLIDVLARSSFGAGAGEVEVIMLTSASRATDMVSLLNELHVREANRTRGDNTVRITADERLNAVLVNAPDQDVQIIKGLVARLDGAKPTTVVETKFIPLQSANAREVVSLIENVLSERGIGRAVGRQSTVLKYVREIARAQGEDVPEDEEEFATEMHVGAAIRESITLTPDVRTNQVIVSAPRESMRMIERMIRDLDASNIGSQDIRIFKLVNADALAMAEILTDLFTLRRQGNIYVLRPREGGFDGPDFAPAVDGVPGPGMAMPGLSGTELTAVPDERQQLSITVDSRTNSLLVSGTPTYLDLVERVVTELDGQEADEREVLVYQLRNAVADEVARVVGQFVDREQQKLVGTLGADQIGSASRLLEREITIVGDQKSNTVLVSASPRYMERVKEMIQRLDVDPPQVLIQVMLAEVTLDTTDDWGVDFMARGRADGLSITGGFGLASAFVTGMGVPNLAVASSDFDLLIRAMKSQGRLQVLSNPSVMAANNEPARIQVGETIRVADALSFSDSGRPFSQTTPQEIGVILEVTPSINPDGFVRMVISPEISSLSSRTTQISEDFEAPVIIKRTADTTVTVFDGQTIVLGGLISDRFERRDRKVPLLGDIPFIGAFFRSETQETAKTELLIVLTPHVIESPASLHRVDEITTRQIDRLTLPESLKDGIRRSRDVRLLPEEDLPGGGGLYDAQGNRLNAPPDTDPRESDPARKEEDELPE